MEMDERSVTGYPVTGAEARHDPRSALQSVPPRDTLNPQNGDPRPERAVEAARTLTVMVQDLVRQLDEQEARRSEMQERVRSLEDAMRGYAALRDQLHGVVSDSITQDDLANMQRVLQALSKTRTTSWCSQMSHSRQASSWQW